MGCFPGECLKADREELLISSGEAVEAACRGQAYLWAPASGRSAFPFLFAACVPVSCTGHLNAFGLYLRSLGLRLRAHVSVGMVCPSLFGCVAAQRTSRSLLL